MLLLDAAKRMGTRPILIATPDATVFFVAENAKSLEEQYLIAAPPVGVVSIFSSKKQTVDL